MLVLSRKKNSNIIINNNITIVVVEIRGDKVRLGVEAPHENLIQRHEVYEAMRRVERSRPIDSTRKTNEYQNEVEIDVGTGIVLPSTPRRSQSTGVDLEISESSASRRPTRKYFVGGFELAEVENDEGSPIVLLLREIDQRMLDYFAEHPEHLFSLPSRAFEEFIAELFSGFGYAVRLTPCSRDGGRDVIAVSHEVIDQRILIECKRYAQQNPVGVSVVRELYGVTRHENATCGVIATTSFFTNDAASFLAKHEWELHGRDFNGIEQWLRLYQERKAWRLGSG